MNSKQRFLAALDRKQPDKVPIFEALIDEPIVVAIVNILGLDAPGTESAEKMMWGQEGLDVLDRYCLLVKELGLDATSYSFSTGLEPVGDGCVRDRYDKVYRLSPHGEATIIEGPIKEPSDVKGYDMASRIRPDDFSRMQYIMEKAGNDKAHIIELNDPFKIIWLLRGGMDHLLLDFMLNPGLVHDLARIATDFNLAAIDMAAKIGVDGFLMDGDLAGEINLLISPEHFREYVKPYHEEIVAHVHQHGLKIIKHSDGNVWPILGDFVDVGFDAFHPVQPQCMAIAEVKGQVGERICLIGNIDCRHLLCFDTEENVEKNVKETIEKAAVGGGYIISSSNSIHPGVKPENYLAMVKAAHKYGVYGRDIS